MTSGRRGAARPRRTSTRLLPAALALLLTACPDDGNFSQYPGFAEWYAANPPASSVPDGPDLALLERHRPRVFLPEGHEGPIDFYRDYIGQGRLFDARGDLISDAVGPDLLNDYKDDPRVTFEHAPTGEAPHPVVYGRVDRDQLTLPSCAEPLPLTFLTYHLVFRTSGLPAGLPGWQETALDAIADLHDWHQLDHYTAVSLALADRDGGPTPIALIFQQHNYMRTYLLDESAGPGRFALPVDGRPAIDVALRSNELYPHRPGRTQRRAVSFLTPDSAHYLVTGEDRPWLAGDDLTDPARETPTELVLLPPADAFYVFEGWLGERRALPGRDGPPGADYNTLPAFKDKALQLAAFFWSEGDEGYLDLIDGLFEDGRPGRAELDRFVPRLVRALPAAALPDCAWIEEIRVPPPSR